MARLDHSTSANAASSFLTPSATCAIRYGLRDSRVRGENTFSYAYAHTLLERRGLAIPSRGNQAMCRLCYTDPLTNTIHGHPLQWKLSKNISISALSSGAAR